jgi:hypothetical protein
VAARFRLARPEWLAPLLEVLRPEEKSRVHRCAADALEESLRSASTARRASAAARLAYHREEAGQPREAGPHHASAGRRALELHDFAGASRHLGAALSVVEPGSPEEGPLARDLGEALFAAGTLKEALEAFERSESSFRRLGRTDEALSAAGRRACVAVRAYRPDAPEMCNGILQRAREAGRTDLMALALWPWPCAIWGPGTCSPPATRKPSITSPTLFASPARPVTPRSSPCCC